MTSGGSAVGAEGLTRVAVYRRTVRASLRRVWENVFDWEHLPWLHAGSFQSIELLDQGAWGWRARVGTGGESALEIELRADQPKRRYVVHTRDGATRGAEIWTRLEPRAEHETDVEVEFLLPGVTAERREGLGQAYTAAYTRLWDEDEAMMRLRQERLDAKPGAEPSAETDLAPVSLGTLDDVRARLPLAVEFGGAPFRVVEVDGELVAHSTICAHLLGPLDESPVEDGCVRCPWHGYRYDVRTGENADGRPLRLARAPGVEVDPNSREVVLVPLGSPR